MLVNGPPPSAPVSSPDGPPAPAPGATTSFPFPGGCIALTDALANGLAPSSLMAAVEDEYESDEDFCWTGNKNGLDFSAVSSSSNKSNKSVALYPSHASMSLLTLSTFWLHLSCHLRRPSSFLTKAKNGSIKLKRYK